MPRIGDLSSLNKHFMKFCHNRKKEFQRTFSLMCIYISSVFTKTGASKFALFFSIVIMQKNREFRDIIYQLVKIIMPYNNIDKPCKL